MIIVAVRHIELMEHHTFRKLTCNKHILKKKKNTVISSNLLGATQIIVLTHDPMNHWSFQSIWSHHKPLSAIGIFDQSWRNSRDLLKLRRQVLQSRTQNLNCHHNSINKNLKKLNNAKGFSAHQMQQLTITNKTPIRHKQTHTNHQDYEKRLKQHNIHTRSQNSTCMINTNIIYQLE